MRIGKQIKTQVYFFILSQIWLIWVPDVGHFISHPIWVVEHVGPPCLKQEPGHHLILRSCPGKAWRCTVKSFLEQDSEKYVHTSLRPDLMACTLGNIVVIEVERLLWAIVWQYNSIRLGSCHLRWSSFCNMSLTKLYFFSWVDFHGNMEKKPKKCFLEERLHKEMLQTSLQADRHKTLLFH